MAPDLIHFYHLFAGAPLWRVVAGEHFQALQDADFPGAVKVGLVGGSPDERWQARMWLASRWPSAELVADQHAGFEQVTLTALREAVQEMPGSTPVLYAHTKGVTVNPVQDPPDRVRNQVLWRQCMQECTVTGWRECAEHLKYADAAGAHWLTPEDMAPFGQETTTPFFGGNYWWARAGYLAGLPPVGDVNRYAAEEWVGLGNPRAVNLAPGYIDHVLKPTCVLEQSRL